MLWLIVDGQNSAQSMVKNLFKQCCFWQGICYINWCKNSSVNNFSKNHGSCLSDITAIPHCTMLMEGQVNTSWLSSPRYRPILLLQNKKLTSFFTSFSDVNLIKDNPLFFAAFWDFSIFIVTKCHLEMWIKPPWSYAWHDATLMVLWPLCLVAKTFDMKHPSAWNLKLETYEKCIAERKSETKCSIHLGRIIPSWWLNQPI